VPHSLYRELELGDQFEGGELVDVIGGKEGDTVAVVAQPENVIEGEAYDIGCE